MTELKEFGPIWMASSPLTGKFETIKKAIDNGVDCIVTKTVSAFKTNRSGERTLYRRKMRDFDGEIHPINAFEKFAGRDIENSDSLFCTSTVSDIELLSIEEANLLYDEIKKYSPETKVIQSFAPRKIEGFDYIDKLKADAIEVSPRFYFSNLERPYIAAVYGDGKPISSVEEAPESVGEYVRRSKEFYKEMERIDFELREGLSNLDLDVPVLFKCERDLILQTYDQLSFPVDGYTFGNTKKCDFIEAEDGHVIWKYGTGSISGERLTSGTLTMIPMIRKNIIGPNKYLSASGGIMTAVYAQYLLVNGANSVQLCSTVYFNGFERVKRISDFVKA